MQKKYLPELFRKTNNRVYEYIYLYVNQTHTWYTHLHTLFLLMFSRNAFLLNKEFNNSKLLWELLSEICTYKSTCKIGRRWSKESKFLGAVGDLVPTSLPPKSGLEAKNPRFHVFHELSGGKRFFEDGKRVPWRWFHPPSEKAKHTLWGGLGGF